MSESELFLDLSKSGDFDEAAKICVLEKLSIFAFSDGSCLVMKFTNPEKELVNHAVYDTVPGIVQKILDASETLRSNEEPDILDFL